MSELPIALVTGATGGIGRAIVRNLAKTHHVIAVGRNKEQLAELSSQGVTAWRADVTEPAHLDKIVAGLTRLDVLVNAAAIDQVVDAKSAQLDHWRMSFETNVFAQAELTKRCLDLLRASQGVVVFIGSGASTKPIANNVIYAATKHALKAYADSLRIQVASEGIRVATVAPGPTDTAMLAEIHRTHQQAWHPERYIDPASVAAAVRFVVDATADVQITDVAVRPRRELNQYED